MTQKLEKQVTTNTQDIKILKTKVANNTDRLDSLESFIISELKTISKKIDNIKMPWVQYVGILAMGSFLTIVSILVIFGGQA